MLSFPLSFPEEYYQGEERWGFYVDETMKRYWACLMDIVNVIDGVCEKYGLTYYGYWGTMLGAVRHKGFVPWDDDVDLVMKRPDYQKLLEVLPSEMPQSWWLSSPFNREGHRQYFSGVSNGREIDISKEHLSQYHNCPFVATVDIFPLDYLPRNPEEANLVTSLFIIIWNAIELVKKEAPQEEIEEAVQMVEEYCGVSVDRSKPLRGVLWKLANQLVMSYQEDEADYLVDWVTYVNREGNFKLDKKLFEETIRLPFETITMPAPADYIKFMDHMYENWQIPNRAAGRGHDYPVFKNQLEFLRRKVQELKEEAGEQ